MLYIYTAVWEICTSSFTQAHISLVWFLFAGECFCSYLHFCEGVSHPHHFAYCNSLHILLPLIENNWEFRVEKIAPIKSGDPWTSSLAFFTHILWFSSLEAALQGKNQIVSPFLCSGKAKLFLKPSQQWLIAISLEQMWASSQFMLNALISSSKGFVKSKNAFFQTTESSGAIIIVMANCNSGAYVLFHLRSSCSDLRCCHSLLSSLSSPTHLFQASCKYC